MTMNLDTLWNHVQLVILNLYDAKVSVHMIISIVSIDSMRPSYHHKILSSTNYLAVHPQILNVHMQLKYGMLLVVRRWVIITTYIYSVVVSRHFRKISKSMFGILQA